MQGVLEELAMDESHKEFAGIDVPESPHKMMELLIQLCEHFGFGKLKEQFASQTLYSPANDYTTQSEARKFCTHCGDKKVGILEHTRWKDLVDHPRLRYVYLCKTCLAEYKKNPWKQEEDHDVDCSCCGDGGNVVLCDFCSHSICSNCIMLHMGVDEWERIQNEEKWSCMVCRKDSEGKYVFLKEWSVCSIK